MLPKALAFVDIETTGTRIDYDRIIEIGIIRVEEDKEIETFQTLINPQIYTSTYIEKMTGISKEDLERAPSFSSVKNQILELLIDAVFVAHNVRFDYGFLKKEFKQEEITYYSKHLCTVKLSRFLYPNFKNHSLDVLISRFNLHCAQRHRAFSDVRAIWDFYKLAKENISETKFTKAFNKAVKKPSVPINLKQKDLDSLPESSGVYIFYSEKGTPLYIGKSINIKERILSHFSNSLVSSREMDYYQEINSIETIQTAGELGAFLTESRLIKQIQPIYNRQLRIVRKLLMLKNKTNDQGYKTVFSQSVDNIVSDDLDNTIQIFKSKKQIEDFLRKISQEHNLCGKILGLEKTKGACFGYHLEKCKGACIGKEDPLHYNLRFIEAISKSKIKSWPFKGSVVIEEYNPIWNLKELFIVDKWCVLSSIKNSQEKEEFKDEKHMFDFDTYKILSNFILSSKNQKKIKQMSKGYNLAGFHSLELLD
ncbi:hypothetical protein C4577_07170 [Candidatus Parcubacteria bacterium]|nr:MAG: hypothetical protein C4577_07170 [Candidatus Parcubacteria bacterium]